MFEHIDQQNAETNRQEKAASAKQLVWPVHQRSKPLTDEQLQKVRDACKALGGRQLTPEEFEIVAWGKPQQKFAYGYPVQEKVLSAEMLQQLADARPDWQEK